MSYPKFAESAGVTVSNVKVTLLRGEESGKQVPENWAEIVTMLVREKAEAVTIRETVTRAATALIKSPVGEEWDIMGDGFARGLPNDTPFMRAWYWTPAAYLRILEARGEELPRDLPRVYTLDASGSPHVAERWEPEHPPTEVLDVIDGVDVSDVTPEYAAERGYFVGRPHSLAFIRWIFASSRKTPHGPPVEGTPGSKVGGKENRAL